MLLAFILGIVIVGFGRAFAYYRVSARFDRWRKAVDRYYSNDWTWGETLAHDAEMGANSIVGSLLAWTAFACFLVGASLGMSALP